MIKRKNYLQKLQEYKDTHIIKVITGQRRVGKTILMKQFLESLPREKVLYINKELQDRSHINTDAELHELVSQQGDKLKYLCIDEIQLIKQWEKTIASIHASKNIDIYITGSNSTMLSSELSTLLAGRYINIHVLPFSYHEFLEYHELEIAKTSFLHYLEEGGFPMMYGFQHDYQKQERLETLVQTIYLKDIIVRYAVHDALLLEELLLFFINNIGNISSLTKLVQLLKNKNIKTNVNTLQIYMENLKNVFLLYQADIYDIQGKRIFDRQRKFYISDHILRKRLFSSYDGGVGKLLENYIFIDAIRHGYKVYVGRIKDKEIDFICEKAGKKIYIQAAYILADEKVIHREFGNLQTIQDSWPKYVVTLDDINHGTIDGIQHIQAWHLHTIWE